VLRLRNQLQELPLDEAAVQRLREQITNLEADRGDLEEAEREYVQRLDAFDEFIERIQAQTDAST